MSRITPDGWRNFEIETENKQFDVLLQNIITTKILRNMKSPIKVFKIFKFILLIQAIVYMPFIQAQDWVWEKGQCVNNQFGLYGTKGISNLNNSPGARKSATTWADTSSNLWLFGGIGYDKDGVYGRLNDLWKYDANSKEWTWMHGQNTVDQSAIYGTQGIPTANTQPGARQEAASVIDDNGNLWLIGGDGLASNGTVGYLNDLWKYDVANNSWIWMRGDTTVNIFGTYGNQGVATLFNKPGGRASSVACLYNNQIWVVGGLGYGINGTSGALNDVWKYNISTGLWTWMKGYQMTNHQGVYGLQGVADPANTPGGRYGHGAWLDNTGNLWIMTGYGYNGIGQYGFLNDVWKYNISSNRWVWIKGSNAVHCPANYGSMGLGYGASTPGARWKPTTWVDKYGHFWLFGGYGRTVGAAYGQLNDLWQYNPITSEWIWMSGNCTIDEKANYGVQNITNTSNKPGGKEGAFKWVDKNGDFWLMGGYGYANTVSPGYMNDLWKYTPNQIPDMNTPSDSIFCGSTTSFSMPLYIQDLDNDSISFTLMIMDLSILSSATFTHLGGANYTLDGILTGNIGTTTCMLLATDEHGASDFTAFEIGVQANSFSNRNVEICYGDSVFLAGNYQKNAGIYQDILTNYKGCDSIVTSNVFVIPQNITYQTANICQGSSYVFGSTALTTSGVYYNTLQSYTSCDSVIQLNLNVQTIPTTYQAISICQGSNYTFGATILTTSGIYYDTLQSLTTCDSIIELNLIVLTDAATILYDTILDSETYLLGNNVLTTEGTYADTFSTWNGCDSIVILNLSVTSISTAINAVQQDGAAYLKVFPNPSDGHFLLIFQIANFKYYQLIITDELGRVVYEHENQNLLQNNGNQEISFDLSALNNGMYIARLLTESNSFVEKIQIAK